MKWYLEVMKQYAVFKGRARRKEYWMFVLINTLIAMTVGFVAGLIDGILGGAGLLVASINLMYALATFIPSLAVAVRRMHDIGRSGWWVLVPLVNFVYLCLPSQPAINEPGAYSRAA